MKRIFGEVWGSSSESVRGHVIELRNADHVTKYWRGGLGSKYGCAGLEDETVQQESRGGHREQNSPKCIPSLNSGPEKTYL